MDTITIQTPKLLPSTDHENFKIAPTSPITLNKVRLHNDDARVQTLLQMDDERRLGLSVSTMTPAILSSGNRMDTFHTLERRVSGIQDSSSDAISTCTNEIESLRSELALLKYDLKSTWDEKNKIRWEPKHDDAGKESREHTVMIQYLESLIRGKDKLIEELSSQLADTKRQSEAEIERCRAMDKVVTAVENEAKKHIYEAKKLQNDMISLEQNNKNLHRNLIDITQKFRNEYARATNLEQQNQLAETTKLQLEGIIQAMKLEISSFTTELEKRKTSDEVIQSQLKSLEELNQKYKQQLKEAEDKNAAFINDITNQEAIVLSNKQQINVIESAILLANSHCERLLSCIVKACEHLSLVLSQDAFSEDNSTEAQFEKTGEIVLSCLDQLNKYILEQKVFNNTQAANICELQQLLSASTVLPNQAEHMSKNSGDKDRATSHFREGFDEMSTKMNNLLHGFLLEKQNCDIERVKNANSLESKDSISSLEKLKDHFEHCKFHMTETRLSNGNLQEKLNEAFRRYSDLMTERNNIAAELEEEMSQRNYIEERLSDACHQLVDFLSLNQEQSKELLYEKRISVTLHEHILNLTDRFEDLSTEELNQAHAGDDESYKNSQSQLRSSDETIQRLMDDLESKTRDLAEKQSTISDLSDQLLETKENLQCKERDLSLLREEAEKTYTQNKVLAELLEEIRSDFFFKLQSKEQELTLLREEAQTEHAQQKEICFLADEKRADVGFTPKSEQIKTTAEIISKYIKWLKSQYQKELNRTVILEDEIDAAATVFTASAVEVFQLRQDKMTLCSDEICHLRNEVEKLTIQNTALKEELSKTVSTSADKNETPEETQRELTGGLSENENVRKSNELLEKELLVSGNSYELEAEQNNFLFQEKMALCSDEICHLRNEVEKLTIQNTALKAELSKAVSTSADKSTILEETLRELTAVHSENENIRKSNELLENELSVARSSYQQEIEQNSNVQSEISAMTSTISSYLQERTELQSNCEKMGEEILSLKTQIKYLQQRLDEESRQNILIREELARAKTGAKLEGNLATVKLEAKMNSLMQQYEDLHRSRDDLFCGSTSNAIISTAREDCPSCNDFKEELRKKDEAFVSLRLKYEQQCDEIEMKGKLALENLMIRLDEKEKEVQKLQEEGCEKETSYKAQIETLKSHQFHAEGETTGKLAFADRLILEEEVRKKDEEIAHMRTEFEQVCTELKRQGETALDDFLADLYEKEKELENLQNETEKKIKGYESQIEHLQSVHLLKSRFEDEARQLRDRNTELVEQVSQLLKANLILQTDRVTPGRKKKRATSSSVRMLTPPLSRQNYDHRNQAEI